MKRKHQFFAAIKVNNSLPDKVLELYFLDDIKNKDVFDWNTYQMSEQSLVQDIIEQVRYYTPTKIKVCIDSEGGSAKIGLGIYNYLKSIDAKIETDNICMAGSIASVIQQAANKGKRKTAKHAFTVIHQAWGEAVGTSNDLRQAADQVDKYTDTIIDIYVQNNTKGKTADDIRALIANGDYWMTGEEAVELGFADECYNDTPTVEIAARLSDLSPEYRNVPQNLLKPEATFLNSIKSEFMEILNEIKNAFTTVKADQKFKGVQASIDILNAIEGALIPQFELIQNKITDLENRKPEAQVFNLADSQEYKDLIESNTKISNDLKTANDIITALQGDIEKIVSGKSDGKSDGGQVKNAIPTSWGK